MIIQTKHGIVIAKNSIKTITVLIKSEYFHFKYKKLLIKRKKYLVHDENNRCEIGNLIYIQKKKRFSRHKIWEVL